jgi:hypothetical protein
MLVFVSLVLNIPLNHSLHLLHKQYTHSELLQPQPELYTDASYQGFGTMLGQKDLNRQHQCLSYKVTIYKTFHFRTEEIVLSFIFTQFQHAAKVIPNA